MALVRSEQPVTVVTVADGARIDTYFRELFVLRDTPAGWRISTYMFSQTRGRPRLRPPTTAPKGLTARGSRPSVTWRCPMSCPALD